MKITYIGYGDFHRYAGMKHMYHFAQEVCRLGHQAQLLIAGKADTVQSMAEPPMAEIVELAFRGPVLSPAVSKRVQVFQPDIIHVWTPRHIPALAGWQLQRLTAAPLILDHEDDEYYHTRYMYWAWTMNWQTGWRRLLAPAILTRNVIRSWLIPLRANGSAFHGTQNFISSRLLVNATSAHTAISPILLEWVRQQWPHLSSYLLYPGADLELFKPQPKDQQLLSELGIENRQALLYSGSLDKRVFRWFMELLLLLIPRLPDIVLVLIGDDSFKHQLTASDIPEQAEGFYRWVGQISHPSIPSYLALADVLIQHPLDIGNELRLPAKLPEYLAMQKPVITYAEGIGKTFEDGVCVRKLYTTDPFEAANLITELMADSEQAIRLGSEARKVACQRFDWQKNGERLISIYKDVLSN